MSTRSGRHPDAAVRADPAQPDEPHPASTAGRLNWLRAAVLGANDGTVSVAGIVLGVAGATTDRGPIFTAGLAGLVAGATASGIEHPGRPSGAGCRMHSSRAPTLRSCETICRTASSRRPCRQVTSR
jgi:hypothetical protein